MKYNFGGAFDIENDMFFTREDLDELGEAVLEELKNTFKNNSYITSLELASVYCEDTTTVITQVVVNGMYLQCRSHISLRTISKPSDLVEKYSYMIAAGFKEQIEKIIREAELNG